MKPHFAKMKCVELMLFLLSYGAFINAQSEAPLRESTKLLNTTTNASVRPSVVVGMDKSSVGTVQPRATSQMNFQKTRAAVTPQNTLLIKVTRAFSNSSMTAFSMTLAPPTTAPRRGGNSNLSLIIGCVVGALVLLAVVCSLSYSFTRRRARCRREKNIKGRGCGPRGEVNLGAREAEADETNDDFSPDLRRVNVELRHAYPVEVVSPGANVDEEDETGDGFSTDLRSSEVDYACCHEAVVDFSSPIPHTTTLFEKDSMKAESYNDLAEDLTDITYSKERLSKNTSNCPGLAKKMITTEGGVIQIDDIILKIGAGCLTKDTEITIKDDQNYEFEFLLKLGLLDAAPRVVEFLPDGLKFLKPADLRIRFEKSVKDSELFVLHGSYNQEYQRRVWELVTNDIAENSVEGIVDMKIHGFCFYSYILSCRGWLARILSHLNMSFSCAAYALYRRLPSASTIDIAVVLVSEFAEKDGEMEQLKRLLQNGYSEGETGTLKRVHTDRRLEMRVDFPDVETSDFQFTIDVPQLDSVGYVVDHFMGIAKEKPANGVVRINEIQQSLERESLWILNIREVEEEIKVKAEQEISTPPDPNEGSTPDVVRRSTELSNGEISRMSKVVGVDWDSLAGLMDIPYNEREEIRFSDSEYPSFYSKAEKIFKLFNVSDCFCRHDLNKCVDELGRHDLKKEISPVESEEPTPPSQIEEPVNEEAQLRNTPLSPREMYRLSRRIAVDWDSLAGLMDIAKEERENIGSNRSYPDDRSRAEKILSLFNRKENFSREKLGQCLEGIKKLEWIKPILTGKWRNL